MVFSDDASIKESCKSAEKKSQKKLLRSMLCCFGRPRRKFFPTNTTMQEEKWIPTMPVENDDPTPTSSDIVHENTEKDSEVQYQCYLKQLRLKFYCFLY